MLRVAAMHRPGSAPSGKLTAGQRRAAIEFRSVMRCQDEFIDISLHESITERWLSVGWSALTDAEREVGCVYLLHWHLLHGGFEAVLVELDCVKLNAAVGGLLRIGASNAAGQIIRVIDGAEASDLAAIEKDLARSELAANQLKLPELYAAAHPEEFPGPRSLIDLWESMQARGVAEKPQRLEEMERRAEADARYTDRRCPTCGQPVPKHKLKCPRCDRTYADDRPIV